MSVVTCCFSQNDTNNFQYTKFLKQEHAFGLKGLFLSAAQITAQELSDNRIITLSFCGRKLDKKVRGFSLKRKSQNRYCFLNSGVIFVS